MDWRQEILDAIKNEDVQRLKAQLEPKSPKTVNNVLTVLSVLLKKAVEWEVIDRMPCTVKLLRVEKGNAAFHDDAIGNETGDAEALLGTGDPIPGGGDGVVVIGAQMETPARTAACGGASPRYFRITLPPRLKPTRASVS